ATFSWVWHDARAPRVGTRRTGARSAVRGLGVRRGSAHPKPPQHLPHRSGIFDTMSLPRLRPPRYHGHGPVPPREPPDVLGAPFGAAAPLALVALAPAVAAPPDPGPRRVLLLHRLRRRPGVGRGRRRDR